MTVSRSAIRWDERRKVAVEALKKQIESYTKSGDKDKLDKAQKVLVATQANMGKGLTDVRKKA